MHLKAVGEYTLDLVKNMAIVCSIVVISYIVSLTNLSFIMYGVTQYWDFWTHYPEPGLLSAAREVVEKESYCASFFPSPFSSYPPRNTHTHTAPPYLVLHLKPPGWYCCRFPLICSPPAAFLLRPLLVVVLPGGPHHTAHLRVGGMVVVVGALNLLMQPFVAITSELTVPLPGSADRCSRTLPQLPAIGYLLLLALCVCVCYPNRGSTQISLWTNLSQASGHRYIVTHMQVHTNTNTQRENKVMSLIFLSYKHIFPIRSLST